MAVLEDAEPADLRRAVPPRGRRTRPHGQAGARALPLRRLPAPGRPGRCRRSSTTQVDADPRPGRRRPGDLRALRRRRLGRGRRARAQGHRPPAHLRLRRHRPACARARASRWSRPSAPPGHRARSTCGPATASSSASPGVTDPEEKRKTIGELFIRVFEERAGGLERRPLPRAGHALPRRHRVGHGTARPRSRATTTSAACPRTWTFELVEPLRALFKDEVRQVGTELGPARRDRLAPAVPRPGPRRAHHRRGHAGEGRHPPAGRRHRPRGDPRPPASSARSGRRSPCCPTSARSA